jgi:hypothetical protein
MTMRKNVSKLFALLVLSAVASIASADGDSGDSSMNPYTGDSWAALQGGGHNLGEQRGLVTVRIAKAREAKTSVATPEGDTALAGSGARRARTSPFRSDTAA